MNIHTVKKFYFLEYFYILLKSVQYSPYNKQIFDRFLELKHKHRLGESRYRKLTADIEDSPNQMVRYRYTFKQVLMEAEGYELLQNNGDQIFLTKRGQEILAIYEDKGNIEFYHALFQYIELKYEAFRYLIKSCYKNNPEKSGLLIFPNYSAYRLGINRDSIRTYKDLHNYFAKLQSRLEDDTQKYLEQQSDLSSKNDELISLLTESDIIPHDVSQSFDQSVYNTVMKRVRNFWLKYFLQEVYHYDISLSAFDIWAYRGKQAGVLHVTEFYPDTNFSGRLVYPLSVIKEHSNSPQFKKLSEYSDGTNLYVHQPSWDDEETQDEFLKELYTAYVDTRNQARSYFVNLPNVRERVCYSMRIPEYLFDRFLGYAYHSRNKVHISLEVDQLPEEAKVMFIRREPVMVDGKARNIIAVDLDGASL